MIDSLFSLLDPKYLTYRVLFIYLSSFPFLKLSRCLLIGFSHLMLSPIFLQQTRSNLLGFFQKRISRANTVCFLDALVSLGLISCSFYTFQLNETNSEYYFLLLSIITILYYIIL